MRLIDLAGMRFGRLTVLSRDGLSGGKLNWACVCDCGEFTSARGDHMRNGRSLSCGCLKAEKAGAQGRTHGLSKTRIYRIWRGMKNRCQMDNHPDWHLYGGRRLRRF
jgi:hypothetical protein